MISGKPTQPCSHDGSSRKEVISIADKKFRGRDKIVQKMTKDGLVDENLRTGEQKSATAAEKPEQEDSGKETAEKETDKEPVMDEEICMDAEDGKEEPPRHHSTAKQSADYYKAHQEEGKPKDAPAESDVEPQTKKGRLSFEDEKGGIVRGVGMGVKKVAKKGVDTATGFAHQKVHQVEKDNSGVEAAHKSEEAAERLHHFVKGRKKPKDKSARAEKRGGEDQKSSRLKFSESEGGTAENAAEPQLKKKQPQPPPTAAGGETKTVGAKFYQKKQYKDAYAAAKRGQKAGTAASKQAAAATNTITEKAKAAVQEIVVQNKTLWVSIGVGILLVMVMLGAFSSCGAAIQGTGSTFVGTTYPSKDADMKGAEEDYLELEKELDKQIRQMESTHPGYDEYRYDLDSIGHNPHELASYLTAKYQSYTRAEVQSELQRIFNQQYKLTLTEEVEIRYREEERTDTWTDEDGNEHTDTYTVQVPYEYYILNVKMTNTPLSTIAENNLPPEQLEMYRVYLQTSGNKPLIFGGGSPDTSASEDLSGVDFVNGTRPGNTAIVDLAKRQVGNVGGYPYWSWYGFNSRVEWCACFVSWCYGQMGLSEPRFAACQSQGIPWFTSHGQWGARGYENIAPGDAIFFDWDLDGSADHVGLVIGRDANRVYTVEGNSGDACKIKSYPLDYACIKGYGLMNWN